MPDIENITNTNKQEEPEALISISDPISAISNAVVTIIGKLIDLEILRESKMEKDAFNHLIERNEKVLDMLVSLIPGYNERLNKGAGTNPPNPTGRAG